MTETRCPDCGRKLASVDADCAACLLGLALTTSSGGDRQADRDAEVLGREHRGARGPARDEKGPGR